MAGADLNSHKDLQEHFLNFSLIVHRFNNDKFEKCNLSKSLEQAKADIESLRISEKTLTEQLQILAKTYQNDESIYLLYIKLKDKCTELEKKCSFLTEQNNLLQEKSLSEVTALEENLKCDKNKLIQEFNQKLKNLKEQRLEERNAFLKRENELYNELQLVQASNAIQCDEMQATEKSLRSQLKDVIDSHGALSQKHLLFKTTNQSELEAAKKAINDLKCKLRFTEQQLNINQEHLFRLNSEIETTRTVHQVTSTACSFKYDALAVTSLDTRKNQTAPEKANTDQLTTTASSHATLKSIVNTTSYGVKANNLSYLPPLKQLSKVGQKPKKRKLYKPGSINYQDFDEVQ